MKLLDAYTDNHDIQPVTEEPYYSVIAEEKGYNLFWFDTWSHDKVDEPCCHVVGAKPFYTTVLDIINYTND